MVGKLGRQIHASPPMAIDSVHPGPSRSDSDYVMHHPHQSASPLEKEASIPFLIPIIHLDDFPNAWHGSAVWDENHLGETDFFLVFRLILFCDPGLGRQKILPSGTVIHLKKTFWVSDWFLGGRIQLNLVVTPNFALKNKTIFHEDQISLNW
ncbi:MAG: hypothetical protein ACKOS8_14355 [Gemmataceae bacterium]